MYSQAVGGGKDNACVGGQVPPSGALEDREDTSCLRRNEYTIIYIIIVGKLHTYILTQFSTRWQGSVL